MSLWLISCLLVAPMGVCKAETETGARTNTTTLADPTLEIPALSPITGWASQYAPGVMPRVVKYQQRHGRLPADISQFDGFIAVRSCSDVGNVYLVRPLGVKLWETFAAADCSGSAETTAWMTRNNILVEIDYETAKRWGIIGHGIRVEMIELEKTSTELAEVDTELVKTNIKGVVK